MQEEYKEFTGKNLDDAMSKACDYYGVERGKLEIEILSDAKSGIFGLVGKKLATIRARRVQLENIAINLNDKNKNGNSKGRELKDAPAKDTRRSEKNVAQATQSNAKTQAKPEEKATPRHENERDSAKEQPRREKQNRGGRNGAPRRAENGEQNKRGNSGNENRETMHENERSESYTENSRNENGRNRKPAKKQERRPAPQKRPEKRNMPHEGADNTEQHEKLPEVPLNTMDQELLSSSVMEAVNALTGCIVGNVDKDIEISSSKVRVHIHSGDDSGLLIGRDGQTLSSLQYLVSCIVSRKMAASVRVQIDAGDYRERQLEKLGELALELAAKVKENGRPQSTRPLSAFQRRTIHMTLQDDPDVQTHSKGDGSMKRVIIVPKRK